MTGSFFFDMDFCACSPIPHSEFRIKKIRRHPRKGAATAKKNQVVGVVKGFT